MNTKDDFNAAALRPKLEAERAKILHDIEASTEARAPVAPDVSIGRLSRMDAMQDQAMALETDRRRHTELDRIDQALARIDSGDYGYCLSCDDKITAKRLDNDPATPLCINCAEKAEG